MAVAQSRRLTLVAVTPAGSFRLAAPSKTTPGRTHDVFVSRDGLRVSCACPACARNAAADRAGRVIVARADVLAGRVRLCWHLRHAARVAPLFVARTVSA